MVDVKEKRAGAIPTGQYFAAPDDAIVLTVARTHAYPAWTCRRESAVPGHLPVDGARRRSSYTIKHARRSRPPHDD
jgi:hypothetical protein